MLPPPNFCSALCFLIRLCQSGWPSGSLRSIRISDVGGASTVAGVGSFGAARGSSVRVVVESGSVADARLSLGCRLFLGLGLEMKSNSRRVRT